MLATDCDDGTPRFRIVHEPRRRRVAHRHPPGGAALPERRAASSASDLGLGRTDLWKAYIPLAQLLKERLNEHRRSGDGGACVRRAHTQAVSGVHGIE